MVARVCWFLALCACVRAGVSVKGYFCQDPDTGLLHGINSTWPSTSFCGNYTCKIRAKNNTIEPAESRTIINVTQPPPKSEKRIELTAEKRNFSESILKPEKQNVFPKDADVFFNSQEGGEAKPIYHRDSVKPKSAIGFNLPFANGAEDRFLNGEEIKTISELLHTVKKSDLEAIIEIYNLAQDIYKEMDEAEASNAIINDTDNGVPEKESSKSVKGNEIENVKKDRTSYWYEPFALNDFHKIADMKPEGSEYVPTSANTYKPQYTQTQNPPTTPPTYFSGTLLNNEDFGKLAYYYPISSFQRLASYYHQQRPQYNAPPPPRTPCSPCYRNPYPTPSLQEERRAFNPPPKPSEPTLLLPYPFSYQFYNGTGYAYNNYNNYYKGNPWAYYDYYKNNPYNFFNIATAKSTPNANPNPSTAVPSEEQKPVDGKDSLATEKAKVDSKPWQTEPLPEDLIKEIRANIVERAKLLKMPFKKRIKLERIAKVIKLDHLNRHAREVRNVKKEEPKESAEYKGDFEVYIEKTTCNSDTEMGYFRVGNMSQPFPHCCPQKIEGR